MLQCESRENKKQFQKKWIRYTNVQAVSHIRILIPTLISKHAESAFKSGRLQSVPTYLSQRRVILFYLLR